MCTLRSWTSCEPEVGKFLFDVVPSFVYLRDESVGFVCTKTVNKTPFLPGIGSYTTLPQGSQEDLGSVSTRMQRQP